MAVSGGRVYVCDPDFGLWILNLSNPSIPVLEKSWSFPDKIKGIFVSGKVGCLAARDLRILNLARSPVASRDRDDSVDPAAKGIHVAFGLNTAYVGDRQRYHGGRRVRNGRGLDVSGKLNLP